MKKKLLKGQPSPFVSGQSKITPTQDEKHPVVSSDFLKTRTKPHRWAAVKLEIGRGR